MTPDDTDTSPKSADAAGTAEITPTSGSNWRAGELGLLGPPSVYSPTQTMVWQRCRRLWQLDRMGWEPRTQEWSPAKVAGSAIHAGWNTMIRTHEWGDVRAAIAATLALEYVDQDQWSLDHLITVCTKAVVALDAYLLMPPEVLVEAECRHGEDVGHVTPDLVTELDGSLIVTQLKTSLKWDPKWWADRVREYHRSWQLLHEAWAVEKKYGKPVRTLRVLFAGVTPKPWVRLESWDLDPAMLAQWALWAGQTWHSMKADMFYRAGTDDKGMLPGDPARCGDYGGCPYLKLCWELGGNLDHAEAFYERRVPRAVRPL